MPQTRIDKVWEEAVAFTRAEAGLLMPIALAFIGLPALLASLALPSAQAMGEGRDLGRVMAIAAIYGLLVVFAGLAISNLVLRRGERVADALEHATRRLGTALLAVLVVGAAITVAMTVLALLLVVVAMVAGVPITDRGSPGFTALTIILVVVPVLALLIRLSTLWPRLAISHEGALPGVVGAWRETGPVAWRLAFVTLLFNCAVQVALLAISLGLGSLGRLLAGPSGTTLVTVAVAAVGAAVGAIANGFWAVFVACLHRALAPAGPADVSAVFE